MMMQAMIFAAGLGTRLKPLTNKMPKALVEVGGEPLLKRVIFKLKDAGVERIVVNVHHFANQIVNYLNINNNFNIDIKISDESQELLETGGGIKKALPLFDKSSPILIHNVDILSNVKLQKFYFLGQDNNATLLVNNRQTKRYLLFDNDINKQLCGWTNIETKEVRSPYNGIIASSCEKYAFSGIHMISPNMFKCFEEMPDKFSIIDFYLKWCDKYPIKGYVKNDLRLMDVGKIDTLKNAEDFLFTI